MAGTRGYHNYRGRTSKAKIALMVLLGVVILAAVVVMLLQRHIVYDETGTPQLELPWQDNREEVEDLPDVSDLNITVGEAESTVPEEMVIQGVALPVGVLSREGWEAVAADADALEITAVSVTLKDGGTVYFQPDAPVYGTVKTEEDTAEILREITGSTAPYHAIAKIGCFHDSKAANSNVEGMGLKNTGGYIFYDGNNTQWMDPGKPAARQYLCDLVQEAAKLGFDEILLTDASYPTEGKLDKIDYGTGEKSEHLQQFLTEVRAVLEPYSMALGIEIPETVLSGEDEVSGLVLREVAEIVDRIYVKTGAGQMESYINGITGIREGVSFVAEIAEDAPLSNGNWILLKE